MHVISKKKLRLFWDLYPDAQGPLLAWHKIAEHAGWANLNELRETYPHADLVDGKYTVFNIGGNKYRLVVGMDYSSQTIFIKFVLTHKDYDKGGWKQR